MIAIEQEYYRAKLEGNSIDWATTNTVIDIYYLLFMNTSSILTWTLHLDSIESNLLDNHKLLHFQHPYYGYSSITYTRLVEEKSHP